MGTDLCFAADRFTRLSCTATACLDDLYITSQNKTAFFQASRESDRYYAQEITNKINRIYIDNLQPEHNLFNPIKKQSQCYIKYTPQEQERLNGRQCMHMQAPVGFNPSIIRSGVRGVSSLNRSKVDIEIERIVKHTFRAELTSPQYSSLWTGEQMPSPDSSKAAVCFSVVICCL